MQYAYFITSPCLNQRIYTIHTNILKYKYQMTFVSCNKERNHFNCRLYLFIAKYLFTGSFKNRYQETQTI